MAVKIDVDLGDVIKGLEADYETLKGNARPAAQAMADVFYKEARANVLRLNQVTGNLYASIYQKYDDDESEDGIARYVVSWRTSGANLPRAPHGHLIEFGYVQTYARYYKDGQFYTDKTKKLAQPRIVPAKPFMRNAYEQGLQMATEKGEALLLKGVAS